MHRRYRSPLIVKDLLRWWRDNAWAHDALASILIVVVALVLRTMALRAVERSKLHVEDQLRWRAQIRNATLAVIALGVVVVWGEELRTIAISLVALAAALAIATKELLMCLLGSTLRASGSSFRVGDRIEVAGVRGDVLDIGPLTTTVLEVGPGQSIHQRTGRTVTVPNSVFLSHSVVNETTSTDYVLHVLRVPFASDDDWKGARERLQAIASRRCAEWIDGARHALTQASPSGVGVNLISTDPVVYLETPEPGRVELLLRFPVPVRRRGRVAQQILRELLGDDRDLDLLDGDPGSASGSHA